MTLRSAAVAVALLVALPSRAEITGYVYSGSGEPLPKVVVRAHRAESPDELRERLAAGIERKTLATATTDDEGAFALDTKVAGIVHLVVAADGFAAFERAELANETDVIVVLSRGTSTRRRVISNGKPLANAMVIVEGVAHAAVARADEQGECVLPKLQGWAYSMTVFHPERGAITYWRGNEPAGDLEMNATPAVGRVVHANGRPAAGARIYIDGWPVGRSRDDGTFSFPLLATNARQLQAALGDSTGFVLRSARELEIRLEPRRVVTGIVRDPKKTPLAGAMVVASTENAVVVMPTGETKIPMGCAVSDERGRFRMLIDDGASFVTAQASSALTFDSHPAGAPGRNTDVVLTAASVPFLRGVVVDYERRPVSGASIQVAGDGQAVIYSKRDLNTISVADGSFRIHISAEHAAQIRLVALHRDHAAGESDLIEHETHKDKITIAMPKGIAAEGVVVDRDGAPVAGAGVIVLEHSDTIHATWLQGLTTRFDSWAHTDAAGKFKLLLRHKPHDLIVTSPAYQTASISELAIDPAMEPIRIVLEPGAAISGRVVRKGGKLAPDETTLTANAARDDDRHETPVAPDGQFSFTGLRPGTYKLSIGSAVQVARAPAADVIVELPSQTDLRGRVIDKATGTPITSFSVMSMEGGDDSLSSGMQFEHGNGEFVLPVEGKRLRVYADSLGYLRSEQQTVVIDPEKPPEELRFALQRGRVIKGRVTDADGTPIEGASVWGQAPEVEVHADTETAEDGQFRIAGASTAAMSVIAEAQGFVTSRKPVPAGDADITIDMVLGKGRTITGRVVTAEGAPAAGVQVQAASTARDAGGRFTQSGNDGTFAIDGLADARYELTAGSQDGYATLKNVDPAKSPPVLLTLRYPEKGRVQGTVSGFTGTPEGEVLLMRGNAISGSGTIARDGTYVLDEIEAGVVTVRASVRSGRNQKLSRAATVTVPAKGEVTVDLKLEAGIDVRGRVTQNGQPVPVADVVFQFLGDMRATWRTVTDDDGSYEIAGLERGPYEISAQSTDGAFTTRRQIDSSATIDMAVDRQSIEGRVVDSEGEPLSGVKIAILTVHEDPIQALTTDPSGGFFTYLRGGTTYRLFPSKHGFAATAIEAEPGGDPIVIRMTRTDGIRVRILDGLHGSTLEGWVQAHDDAGRPLARNFLAGADGAIPLPLTRGSYRISASAIGYAAQSVRVSVPSSSEVRIALTAGGVVEIEAPPDTAAGVRFVMPNGENYIHCLCAGDNELRATGAWTRINSVAAGTYTMQLLDLNGRAVRSYPVVVREGQITTVKVD